MAGKPKPTHLKLVQGTIRKDRTNLAEPRPDAGRPAMPGHLSKRAAATWIKLSKLLNNMGVLSAVDGLALGQLCECYAEILDARAKLEAYGSTTYETQTLAGGRMVRGYPEVAMLADADRRFRGYLGEFGLTPATRSKVSGTEPGKNESEFG